MKLVPKPNGGSINWVAPYTGAWIEIILYEEVRAYTIVAPYTGAWIEINREIESALNLKVAPYTGAWIEIFSVCSVRLFP